MIFKLIKIIMLKFNFIPKDKYIEEVELRKLYQSQYLNEKRNSEKNELEERISILENSINARDREIETLRTREKIWINDNDKQLDTKKLKQWSKTVRERDGKCVACNSTKDLTAHHKYSKSIHVSLAYMKSNGITLCKICHRELHIKYGNLCEVENLEKFLLKKEGDRLLANH
jgi:5-methylcytosine-specific restriction endonuclease McrA